MTLTRARSGGAPLLALAAGLATAMEIDPATAMEAARTAMARMRRGERGRLEELARHAVEGAHSYEIAAMIKGGQSNGR